MVDRPGLRLGLGDSVNYTGDADLVFSHLYGPLPPQLIGKPAIVNVYGNKREAAERWCGAELHHVSKWGKGLTNTLYLANIEPLGAYSLGHLVEDEFAPGRGWFPVDLVKLGLSQYARPGMTIFDGFMGRGTVGKVACELNMKFVGIDRDPDRVAIAQEYLAN